jgi:hypothetical protein
MNKGIRVEKCVHCLRNSKKMNWDHVFPESWYPATTPDNLEKWKIPSCVKCNSDYGEMERKMLHRLGLTLSPENLFALGITDKVHRALDGSFGKNDRDRIARDKECERIRNEIIEVTTEYEKVVYPSLNPIKFTQDEKRMGIPIPHEWFEKLAIKIVRGITFIEHGSFIEEPYEITFMALKEQKSNPILQGIAAFGYAHFRGPGLVIHMARADEDPISSVWVIDIWRHVRLFAFCIDKNLRKLRDVR